ncbi:MAG: transposase, partial [Thermoplasmata archaeon]
TVEELRWRAPVFDRLREAMRIASVDGRDGLKDEGSDADMSTIRHGVEKFRQEIKKDPKLAADSLCHKMVEQIDKYGEKLFADPIRVDTPNGPITVYPRASKKRFFG